MEVDMLKIKVLFIALLLLFITLPAHGQSSSTTSDTWQFEVSPYLFLPAVEGDATVNGQTMPLDLSFGDILDNFDVFGLSGRVRARKGKWGIIFDVATLSLETEVIPNIPIPPVTAAINVDIQDTVVDLGVSYRVVETEVGGKRLWIEPLVGVRYHYLKQEIGLKIDILFPDDPPGLVPAGTVLGGDEDWFEPLVGGIIGLALTEKFTLLLRGYGQSMVLTITPTITVLV
jgi:hypothetical protein